MILAYFKISCHFLPWCHLADDSCTCKCVFIVLLIAWLTPLATMYAFPSSFNFTIRFAAYTNDANINDCCGDNGRFHPFVIVVCLCAFMTLVVLRLPLSSSWSGSTANETVIFWAFKQIKFHLQWVWFTFHSSLGSLLNLFSSVLIWLCGLFAKRQKNTRNQSAACHIYISNNVLEICREILLFICTT